jgi:hypothetical protein
MDPLNNRTNNNFITSQDKITAFVTTLEKQKPQAYNALAAAVKAASSSSDCNWAINNQEIKDKMLKLKVIDSSGNLATSVYNVVFAKLQSAEDVGGGGAAAAGAPKTVAKTSKIDQFIAQFSLTMYSQEDVVLAKQILGQLNGETNVFERIGRIAKCSSNVGFKGTVPKRDRKRFRELTGMNTDDISKQVWNIMGKLIEVSGKNVTLIYKE